MNRAIFVLFLCMCIAVWTIGCSTNPQKTNQQEHVTDSSIVGEPGPAPVPTKYLKSSDAQAAFLTGFVDGIEHVFLIKADGVLSNTTAYYGSNKEAYEAGRNAGESYIRDRLQDLEKADEIINL